VTAARPAPSSWVLAARPKTLWAAVAPVLVGSALAAADDAFRWDAFVVTLVAALLIQVGVNFANDVADAGKGADTGARIGPTRAVASGLITPRQMWFGIAVAFGGAALAGLYLIYLGGWPILAIGVTSIVAALGYTNGPVPYGYVGLGEVFVFVFFGLAATVGTRFVYDRSAPADAWILAVPMGLLASAILVANNYRDMDTDAVAGKRTLAVALGRHRTAILYAAMVGGAFAVIVGASVVGWLPGSLTMVLIAAPLAAPLIRTLWQERAGPPLIRVLVGTARLQIAVALLVAAGLMVSR
jgi:1,4-dihydroxy-2-naphthoate polyprenyltransferase